MLLHTVVSGTGTGHFTFRQLHESKRRSRRAIFDRGSHALPLDKFAAKYGGDTAEFLKKGISLGGVHSNYGDASIKLYPFPKIPVLLMLWRKNEEFPANAVLLLDTACQRYLPTDIIWATAMVSVLVMF